VNRSHESLRRRAPVPDHRDGLGGEHVGMHFRRAGKEEAAVGAITRFSNRLVHGDLSSVSGDAAAPCVGGVVEVEGRPQGI